MNSNQKIVLGITAASLALILFFPPFDQFSIANSRVPVFAGFYLYFTPPPLGVINTSLLLLEVFVVLINAGFAWLALRDKPGPAGSPPATRIGYQNAVLIFAGLNLILVMVFPPLESVFALTNAALPSFEGFYFIFTKHPNHTVVTTLLYLEVIFILVNAALAWLIFRQRTRATLSPQEARALAMALRARR
jgi:hypothetical protein